jgi:hypothetical protein
VNTASPSPPDSLLARWYERGNQCVTPQFGQCVNWVLIGVCFLLGCLPFETVAGERQGPATVLSWLPLSVFAEPNAFFYVFRVILLVGASLWLFQRGLPWSSWMATLGFTALWSLHMETTTNGAHIFNVTNQLLIVQTLWVTFYAREIRQAWRSGEYWSTPLYPHWAFWLGLAYLGLFHSFAGFAKLAYSGTAWANGVSLQLWAYWDGRPGSWMRELIIHNRPLVVVLQWATLLFESAGILALFDRRLRMLIGLAILSFYFGVVMTFDYGFHINFLLTALYHLPFDAWLPKWFPGTRSSLPGENQPK